MSQSRSFSYQRTYFGEIYYTFTRRSVLKYFCVPSTSSECRKQFHKFVLSLASTLQYVYIRQKKSFDSNGQAVWVILGRSATKADLAETGEVKEKSGVIRVEDFVQGIAITSNGSGGTKAVMHYYDDPKGSIPTWLINWGAKSGVPDFLSKMETACNGYKEYLEMQ